MIKSEIHERAEAKLTERLARAGRPWKSWTEEEYLAAAQEAAAELEGYVLDRPYVRSAASIDFIRELIDPGRRA